MAKLPQETREAANEADGSGFDVMEPHTLHYRLRNVDTSRSGAKGPYWVWEYECVEAPYKNRRQWNNTSLGKASAVFVKQSFAAVGADLEDDIEDYYGTIVKLQVGVRTIQEGARKGEDANQVNRVMKADADFDADGESGEKQEASIF